MKRKFFSTLLFGALACTTLSTVTSCKDYDDDIKNLQTQIDQKAALTKITDLETQVAAAKSAAEQAYTEAKAKATPDDVQDALDEARDYADLVSEAAEKSAKEAAAAAVEAHEKAVNDSLKNYMLASEIEKKLQELEEKCTEVDNAQEDEIEALATLVANWGSAIEQLYSAVTGVSLVASYQNSGFVQGAYDLTYLVGTVNKDKDIVFGKDQTDDTGKKATDANSPYTYKKGSRVDFPQEIVVRVNPVNATVTPSMIKLVDSEGNNLNDVLKVTDVKKYDNLLTRGTDATGLWTVELSLADGVKNDEIEQKAGDKHVLYAMAVNNTSYDSTRYVVSTYDITLQEPDEYTGAESLSGIELKSATQQPEWTALSKISGRDENPDVVRDDDATDLIAANGETISVRFNTESDENADKIDRFYIVRDDNHAETTSAPSEINVWNSYKYTGLGEIVEVKNGTGVAEFTATIPSTLKTGDQIAFRIFAVNYDGTIVDANGEGFNVTVVNPQNEASVTGDIVATSTTPSTAWLPITNASNLTTEEVVPAGITFTLPNKSSYAMEAEFAKDAEGKQAAETVKDAKYVKFIAKQDISQWEDGTTLTGTMTTKGTNGEVISKINVSLTKKLPTDADAKALFEQQIKWKDNQKINGVYTAYVFNTVGGEVWTKTTETTTIGYTNLEAALTGFKGSNFSYIVENAAKGEEDKDGWAFDEALETTGTQCVMTVIASETATKGDIKQLVDNKTEHATKIVYNFGKVSSKSKDDVKCVADEFKTIFACPLSTLAQTFAWKQIPAETNADGSVKTPAKDVNYVVYGVDDTTNKIADYLIATNSFNNLQFGGAFSKVATLYKESAGVKVELISNESKNADYFDVIAQGDGNGGVRFNFKAKNKDKNPKADVASTLKLTLTDAFGHENVYEMPFTVKSANNE